MKIDNDKGILFQTMCKAPMSVLLASLTRLISSGQLAVSQAAIVYHQVATAHRKTVR